jgi:hypothetical protein
MSMTGWSGNGLISRNRLIVVRPLRFVASRLALLLSSWRDFDLRRLRFARFVARRSETRNAVLSVSWRKLFARSRALKKRRNAKKTFILNQRALKKIVHKIKLGVFEKGEDDMKASTEYAMTLI